MGAACDSYLIQTAQQSELNQILAAMNSAADLPPDQHVSLSRRLDELLTAIEDQTFKRFNFLR